MHALRIIVLSLITLCSLSAFAIKKSFPIHLNLTMSSPVENITLAGRDGGPIRCQPDAFSFTSLFGFGPGSRQGEVRTMCEDLSYNDGDYISIDIKYQGDAYYNMIPAAVTINLRDLKEGQANNCFIFGNQGQEQVRCG